MLAVRAPSAVIAVARKVAIIWPAGEIRNTWLQVAVKVTAGTGLDVDHVFYYGNVVGETSDAPDANAFVNSVNRKIALNNETTFVTDLNGFTVLETVNEGSASAGGSRLVYRSQQALIDAVFGSVDDERGLLFDI